MLGPSFLLYFLAGMRSSMALPSSSRFSISISFSTPSISSCTNSRYTHTTAAAAATARRRRNSSHRRTSYYWWLRSRVVSVSGAARGGRGKLPPYGWTSRNYVIYVCAFVVMELVRITRQIHCKAVEQRATLIHRQYSRDRGTSYSRPPIDPYLTSPLLQNAGGATG